MNNYEYQAISGIFKSQFDKINELELSHEITRDQAIDAQSVILRTLKSFIHFFHYNAPHEFKKRELGFLMDCGISPRDYAYFNLSEEI